MEAKQEAKLLLNLLLKIPSDCSSISVDRIVDLIIKAAVEEVHSGKTLIQIGEKQDIIERKEE